MLSTGWGGEIEERAGNDIAEDIVEDGERVRKGCRGRLRRGSGEA